MKAKDITEEFFALKNEKIFNEREKEAFKKVESEIVTILLSSSVVLQELVEFSYNLGVYDGGADN